MRLRIATPLEVVVDEADVRSLCAEDASGVFGIMPRHAPFVTSLTIGVVRWRLGEGAWHHCAVRRGMLVVDVNRDVAIATREAVRNDDLATLDETVLSRFRADVETERKEHLDGTRLQLAAIRAIVQHLDGRAGSLS